MDACIDLDAASRDELIALIVQQQTVIGCLERRIAQLEDKAKSGGPSGMPGLKPGPARNPRPPAVPKSPAPRFSCATLYSVRHSFREVSHR